MNDYSVCNGYYLWVYYFGVDDGEEGRVEHLREVTKMVQQRRQGK